MPLDNTKVLVGAGVFSIGNWVPAGAAGTLADVGHIKSPYELGVNFENFDIETERASAPIKTSPVKSDFTIKVAFHQAEAEWMKIAFAQPDANLTPALPSANRTLLVGDRIERYHQATLVVPGPGTTAVDTYTFWKVASVSMDPISFGKAVEQMYVVTFRIVRDDTVASLDKYFKRVSA